MSLGIQPGSGTRHSEPQAQMVLRELPSLVGWEWEKVALTGLPPAEADVGPMSSYKTSLAAQVGAGTPGWAALDCTLAELRGRAGKMSHSCDSESWDHVAFQEALLFLSYPKL